MRQPGGLDEYRESRERLFVAGWPVAADYRIEEGLVVPLDEAGRRVPHDALDPSYMYMPLARPELPAEFGKLSGAGEEAVLRFVRRYGLPGYGLALTVFERNILERAQSVPGYDPLIDKGYDVRLPGDPVAWILAHADSVQFVGALAAVLDAPDELRRLFERRIVADDAGEELRFVRAVRGRTRPKEGRLPAPDAKSRRATALGIIALGLNDNLGGIARTIQVDGARLVSIFRPNNLLDSMYWLLADEVTRGQLRVCEECGHFFAATDERMKYCPPAIGLEGPSRCMHRAKMRRWRQGQQAGTPRRKGRRIRDIPKMPKRPPPQRRPRR